MAVGGEPPRPGAIVVSAPAKINLYLHVTGKRDDGYHLLDSLVAFAGIQDRLVIGPADDLELLIEGRFSGAVPAGAGNIVLRAAGRLAEAAGVEPCARIDLVKRLPVSAGLGGGSADAAAALRGLSALWGVRPGEDDLLALALELGADVPVCFAGKAAYMGGIGGDLEAAPLLPEAWLALVNPGRPLATAAVFGNLGSAISAPARFPEAPTDADMLAALLRSRDNGLTEAARGLEPTIGQVLSALEQSRGVLLARMTGSGATCFGLCADESAAAEAASKIAAAPPRMVGEAGGLGPETQAICGCDSPGP